MAYTENFVTQLTERNTKGWRIENVDGSVRGEHESDKEIDKI